MKFEICHNFTMTNQLIYDTNFYSPKLATPSEKWFLPPPPSELVIGKGSSLWPSDKKRLLILKAMRVVFLRTLQYKTAVLWTEKQVLGDGYVYAQYSKFKLLFVVLISVINAFPVQSILGTPAPYSHTGKTTITSVLYIVYILLCTLTVLYGTFS